MNYEMQEANIRRSTTLLFWFSFWCTKVYSLFFCKPKTIFIMSSTHDNSGTFLPAHQQKHADYYNPPHLPYQAADKPLPMVSFQLEDENGERSKHAFPYQTIGECVHVKGAKETVTAAFHLARSVVTATITGGTLDKIFEALTTNTLVMVEKTTAAMTEREGEPTVAKVKIKRQP